MNHDVPPVRLPDNDYFDSPTCAVGAKDQQSAAAKFRVDARDRHGVSQNLKNPSSSDLVATSRLCELVANRFIIVQHKCIVNPARWLLGERSIQGVRRG